jgi:hypothetical protein
VSCNAFWKVLLQFFDFIIPNNFYDDLSHLSSFFFILLEIYVLHFFCSINKLSFLTLLFLIFFLIFFIVVSSLFPT